MTSRVLTAGEIALARAIFGDEIDYGIVRIHDEAKYVWQPPNTIMTPDGSIYYPSGNAEYQTDISSGTYEQKSYFLHEMTHVWQHQHGVDVPRTALDNHYRNYNYDDIFNGKTFGELALEQQAEFIQDYYLLSQGQSLTLDKKGGSVSVHIFAEYQNELPFDFAENPNFDDSIYVMQGEPNGAYGPGGNGGNADYDNNGDSGDTGAAYIDNIEDKFATGQGNASPLVLDLDGDGIELTSLASSSAVYWDIDSAKDDGVAEATGWVTGGDGLLAVDLGIKGVRLN